MKPYASQKVFKVLAPYVSLNGTSREFLINQKREINEALARVETVMKDNGPHSRDYLQGGGTLAEWEAVKQEHAFRLGLILDLKQALLDEMIAIDNGHAGTISEPPHNTRLQELYANELI